MYAAGLTPKQPCVIMASMCVCILFSCLGLARQHTTRKHYRHIALQAASRTNSNISHRQSLHALVCTPRQLATVFSWMKKMMMMMMASLYILTPSHRSNPTEKKEHSLIHIPVTQHIYYCMCRLTPTFADPHTHVSPPPSSYPKNTPCMSGRNTMNVRENPCWKEEA